jgi:NAD(P)-dependent dehydrogenase (short-subunit alcohol dehydrogenase family)/acyl carrier protein
VSYVFTDVSARFTSEARRTFAAYPFVRYERLDVERDPEKQGFQPHEFDVVIAANVLHATANVGDALARVRRLLAPGGVLLLLEGIAPAWWLDVTFGLTDGWWRFADDRAAHPLLSAEAWRTRLSEQDFDQTVVVTAPADQRHAVSQQALILARAGTTSAVPTARRRVIVFGDRGGVGRDVAARLERDPSIECVTVSPAAPSTDGCRQVGDRDWIVDPARPADVADLVERVAADAPLAGVVYTHALDVAQATAADSGDVSAATAPAWQGVLHLAPALVRLRQATSPRVWLVTRGAQSVAGEALPGLGQSPLWGLGVTLAVEHPDLATTLVDVDPDGDADVAAAIAEELRSGSAERRVAWRGSTRYAARLARVDAGARPSSGDAARLSIRGDRTYLIAGGLGGLGTLVARRFAERGARHLALVGRSDPSPAARAEIEALERDGVAVAVLRADVADAGQVAAVVAEIDRRMPALAGVVHAAGTLDNATLTTLDAARFARVLAPKLDGAWNLHRLTADRPLDVFALFSSAASLLGAHGQANHAAASAFLDALAHDRRARGLPALSVNWSAWAEVGAAVRDGALLRVKGVRPIAPERGLDAYERVAALDRPQVVVLPIDWAAFVEQSGTSPWLADVAPAPAAPTIAKAAPSPLGGLHGVSAAEARGRIAGHIAARVAAVLGLPASARIHPRQGFFDMGMDSLTSVELANRLQADLGCKLPSTVAMDFPNIDALADHLAAQLFPPAPPSAPAAAPATPAASAADALARISDAEAEAMLLRELDEMNL